MGPMEGVAKQADEPNANTHQYNTHSHTYTHTYIHTYTHTYMHTYKHTYVHVYAYDIRSYKTMQISIKHTPISIANYKVRVGCGDRMANTRCA